MRLDERSAHLARPDGTPKGAVLVLGGSEGGHHPDDADALAREGFVVLSYSYFGAPGTPEGLVRIPLEFLMAGVDVLQKEAPDQRIGVLGGSRGGEAALLLASVDTRVRAVVSVVGSGVVTAGIDYSAGHLREIVLSRAVAWTYRGKDIAGLPHVNEDRLDAVLGRDGPVRLRDTYETLDGADLENVAIPVEKGDAAILAISASDDRMWDSPSLSAVSFKRLDASGHPRARRHAVLDSGHAIAGPPPTSGPTELPGPGVTFDAGGSPVCNVAAQREAWRLTVEWFETELAD